MKYSRLINFFVVLLFCYILLFPPFISDVFIPKLIRAFFPFLFFLIAFILIGKKGKEKIIHILFVILILCLFFLFWIFFESTLIYSNAISILSSIVFLLVLISLLKYNNLFQYKVEKYWKYFIWISICSSILSYTFFNFFNFNIFNSLNIGDYSESNTYFNLIFGVISEKKFLNYSVGRPAWFFSEPSYMGFFNGLNYIWFSQKEKEGTSRNVSNKIGKYLSLVSLIVTFSIGSWIALTVAIILTKIAKAVPHFFDIRINLKKVIKSFTLLLFTTLLIIVLFKFTLITDFIDTVIDNVRNFETISSIDDRTNRINNSLNIILHSNIFQLIIGHGPGTIENVYQAGESNSWVKTFIEEGVMIFLLYLVYLFYNLFNKKHILLFLFLIISFNSVILMFSPIILLYILLFIYRPLPVTCEQR